MNKENHTTKIFFTQTLNSIISGILTILIPLLMLERNIDVVTIGFVFAAMPFVFQTIRLFFGAISDIIGRKRFFVLNSLLNIVVLIIYSVAATPLVFLSGKVAEGVKDASIWSVNRAALMDFRKDKRKILTKFIGVTNIASSIGNIAAGFLILWLSYTNTIILAIFLAILSVPVALSLRIKKIGKLRKVKIKQILNKIDIRNKDNRFKKFTLLSLINGLTMGFVTGYIFPLFLNENGFGVEIIGLILGLNVLLIGISSIATRKVEIKKLILYGGILYSLSLLFLGFSGGLAAAAMILVVGVTRGFNNGVSAAIMSRMSHFKSYAGDVGILTTGLHIGRAISFAASGIIITYLGFFGVFATAAIIYSLYFSLVYFEFKKMD